MVVKTCEANLQKFMQRFNTSYTVYFNKRHKRSGHLYQGRYKAILIEADEYLLEVSRYVHLNPVHIKKYENRSIQDKVQTIRDYRWSSYGGYVHKRKRREFVTYEMVLQMLTGRDDRKGRQEYAGFVLDGLAKDLKKSMWDDIRGQAVMGTESFIDHIYEKFLMGKKVDEREQPGAAELKVLPISIEEIAKKVAEAFSVADHRELYRKHSTHREARALLQELCLRNITKKMNMTEIGRQLGGISGAALIVNSKRLESVMQKNKKVKKRFEKLEKEINS